MTEKLPNTPDQSRKKAPYKPAPGGEVKERGIEEAISEIWRLIDLAKKRLADPKLREGEKVKWASILSQAIGTLNKLYYKAGMEKVDDEDLAQILSKLPEKYAKKIMKSIMHPKK